jgi:hypothetical protein
MSNPINNKTLEVLNDRKSSYNKVLNTPIGSKTS